MGDIHEELKALRLRKDLERLRMREALGKLRAGEAAGPVRPPGYETPPGNLPGAAVDKWREPDTIGPGGNVVAGDRKRLSTGDQLKSDALDVLGGGLRGVATLGGLAVDAMSSPYPAMAGRDGVSAKPPDPRVPRDPASLFETTAKAEDWGNRRIEESKRNAGLDAGALELQEGRSEGLRLAGEIALDPTVALAGTRVAKKAGSKADEIMEFYRLKIRNTADPNARKALEEEMRRALGGVAEAAPTAPAVEAPSGRPGATAAATETAERATGKPSRVSRALHDERWVQAGTTTLKQTPSGAEAAAKLHEVEAMADAGAARPLRSLEKLPKWSPERRKQLAAVLDGRLDPSQVDDELARVADEQRRYLDEVAEAAKAAGVQLRTPDGRTVPFGRREDYFPHWKRPEDGANVFRAEVPPTPEGTAIGSLQHTRTADDGEFLDDALDVLPAYFENAWRRIAETKHFGPDIGGAVDDYVKRAAEEGANEATIREILSQALGGGVRSGADVKGLARDAMNVQVGTKLVTSVLSNATQTANTTAAAGFKNAARAVLDVGKWLATKNDETIRAALDSGATVEAFKRHLVQGREDVWSARFANFVLQNTGFNFVEKLNRLVAAQAGALRADQYVRLAQAGNRIAVRKLEELGIDAAEVLRRGGLLPEERARAGFEMSHRTQFGLRPEDLPPGWSATPGAKVLLQFKSFGFKQAKFMRDEILRPAMRPGPERDFGPLARYLVAGGVLYGTAETVRDALFARLAKEPPSVVKRFVEGAGLAAMAGLWGQAMGVPRFGIRGASEFVLGPTGSDVFRQVETLSEATVGAAKVGLEKGPRWGAEHARRAWMRDVERSVSGVRAITDRTRKSENMEPDRAMLQDSVTVGLPW